MRILVTGALAGSRLDAALHALAPDLSRHAARRLCEIGAVAVGGVRGSAQQRVRAGDGLAWNAATVARSLELSLPVVHEDEAALVLHKPPGLAVHAGPLVDDSVARRLEALPPGVGLAQRLDRGASGLLLIGRDKASLRELAQAMERGEIEREYVAVAAGEIAFDERTIDLPLLANDEPRGDRPKVVVDHERGQRAVTHVRVLARRGGCSLLAVRLETGRTHQIRAHLRAAGHPLLGDERYGDVDANRRARETHGVARVMLHAVRLAFPGPGGAGRVEVRAAWEPDFVRVVPVAVEQIDPGA